MSDVAQKADASLSWNECCTIQMDLEDRGTLQNIVVVSGCTAPRLAEPFIYTIRKRSSHRHGERTDARGSSAMSGV